MKHHYMHVCTYTDTYATTQDKLGYLPREGGREGGREGLLAKRKLLPSGILVIGERCRSV